MSNSSTLNPDFRHEGKSLDRFDLINLAHDLIGNGQEFEKPIGQFLLDWFDSKSFVSLKTSGSTGNPKTILVQKQAMINSAIATGQFFDLQPNQRILLCLPTEFVAGKMMLVRAMTLGLDIYWVEPKHNPLKNNKLYFDFCAMVPLQAQNSIMGLHQIKTLIIGGAATNIALQTALLQQPTHCFETYGMTETVSHIAVKKIGETYFSIMPNISISVDINQCLVIDAPQILPKSLVTNDIVCLKNKSQFELIGRLDNVVNSGGVKLFPEKIAKKLQSLIEPRFYFTKKTDLILGQKLILVVEGDFFEINPSVFAILDQYETPKEIIFVPKFEETASGKIIMQKFI